MKKMFVVISLTFLTAALSPTSGAAKATAEDLLAEAAQLVTAAREAEATSYAKALRAAQAIELADDKAPTLAEIGGELAKGSIKIGPTEKKILREITGQIE